MGLAVDAVDLLNEDRLGRGAAAVSGQDDVQVIGVNRRSR